MKAGVTVVGVSWWFIRKMGPKWWVRSRDGHCWGTGFITEQEAQDLADKFNEDMKTQGDSLPPTPRRRSR